MTKKRMRRSVPQGGGTMTYTAEQRAGEEISPKTPRLGPPTTPARVRHGRPST
ncbi:MAG TPA: hypothetical protein VGR18_07630 [Rubrobacter sp.]|nr:hypothetical protein [Rubrobacter sp.]